MLSLRTVLPTMPMVAALSSAHLAALLIPAGLQCLYVAVDDDRAGRHAVKRLRDREDLRGIELCELIPTLGDFNEDLRRRGPEALVEAIGPQLAREDVARFLVDRRREAMTGLAGLIGSWLIGADSHRVCPGLARGRRPRPSERAISAGGGPAWQRLRATFFP